MRKTLVACLLFGTYFAFPQAKKHYNIGILLDHPSKDVRLLDRLKTQIKAVVGEDATVDFPAASILSNAYDEQKAEANYRALLTNATDIILAFGLVNHLFLSQQRSYAKPTILFGRENQAFSKMNAGKRTSGMRNLTYLVQQESYSEDMKRLKELTHFKCVGIFVEKKMAEMMPLEAVFDKVVKSLGARYQFTPFESLADITSQLDGVDAVYLAGGFFLKEAEVRQLAQLFIEKQLPSFTINGLKQVKIGLMATHQPEGVIDQFLRRIALTIDAYIGGTPLADMPVFLFQDLGLTINYNTASRVGVPLKYSLFTTADFVGEFDQVSAEKQYHLREVIDLALQENLSLKASKKNIALSGQNVRHAKSQYLPSLTANASATYTDPALASVSRGQNPEYSSGANITLQQTVFSASASTNIKVQKYLKKAQEETYHVDELNTIFTAAHTYFNVLILKANVKVQLGNLELTKSNLAMANQNFEAGQKGKTDVLRFRSQLSQNMQSTVQAINQLKQGLIGLNQLLNHPVDYRIAVEEVEWDEGIFKNYHYDVVADILDDPLQREPFIAFLTEEAKSNVPELKSLAYNLQATDKTIRLNTLGRFLPTLTLQGQYNRNFVRAGAGSTFPETFGTPLDGNYNAGLNLSIPIINRTQTNIARQRAIIQKEQLKINRANTTLSVSANVRTGVLNIYNQMVNIDLSKAAKEAAKEALALTQASYSNGAVNIVQLIDAQNNYLSAELAQVSATYYCLISFLQLERYLGTYFLLKDQTAMDDFSQHLLEFLIDPTENK